MLPFKVCSIQKDPKVFSVISGSGRVETSGRMSVMLLLVKLGEPSVCSEHIL